MTSSKAIEILSLDLTYAYPALFLDLQAAARLGREALKEVIRLRSHKEFKVLDLLPGEDPE